MIHDFHFQSLLGLGFRKLIIFVDGDNWVNVLCSGNFGNGEIKAPFKISGDVVFC